MKTSRILSSKFENCSIITITSFVIIHSFTFLTSLLLSLPPISTIVKSDVMYQSRGISTQQESRVVVHRNGTIFLYVPPMH